MNKIKTALEMLDERKTIQTGQLKGARISLSDSAIIELMEGYHEQLISAGANIVTTKDLQDIDTANDEHR
jgi:hypothetical protein